MAIMEWPNVTGRQNDSTIVRWYGHFPGIEKLATPYITDYEVFEINTNELLCTVDVISALSSP